MSPKTAGERNRPRPANRPCTGRNHTDYCGLLLDGLERAALFVFELYPTITKRSQTGRPFPLFGGGETTALQPAVDNLVLAAAHKQAELEILFIELVVGVIRFYRGDYFRPGELERLCDDALVDCVAARQTLDLHDEDAGPNALLNLRENPLHHRTGSDGVTGDDLAVNIGHV